MKRLLPVVTALPVLMAWVVGGSAATLPPAPDSGPQAAKAVSDALGAVLRADVPAALALLKAAPVEQFNRKDATFRGCMLARHERRAPPQLADAVADPLARQVLEIYQRYWWHAVRDPATRPALDAKLKAELAALTGQAPPADGDDAFDAMVEPLNFELRKRGFHPLQGRTPPLYDLFLWGRQEERDYQVSLPGGERQPVRVFLMDDWLSRGWSHHVACGATGAAGWVQPEGLYAVRSSYGDLKGEDFRVSFLGHEAQHFADLKRWPQMPPWTLEYRAKLVELAQADSTRGKLLDRFYRSQDDEPDHPHPYANKRVIAAVAARLGRAGDAGVDPGELDPGKLDLRQADLRQADLRQADPAAVRKAAAGILIEDTRQREAAEPAAAAASSARSP